MSESTITQTEHRRLHIDVDADGVRITDIRIEGYRMPQQTVYVTNKEFAAIARKVARETAKRKATK